MRMLRTAAAAIALLAATWPAAAQASTVIGPSPLGTGDPAIVGDVTVQLHIAQWADVSFATDFPDMVLSSKPGTAPGTANGQNGYSRLTGDLLTNTPINIAVLPGTITGLTYTDSSTIGGAIPAVEPGTGDITAADPFRWDVWADVRADGGATSLLVPGNYGGQTFDVGDGVKYTGGSGQITINNLPWSANNGRYDLVLTAKAQTNAEWDNTALAIDFGTATATVVVNVTAATPPGQLQIP